MGGFVAPLTGHINVALTNYAKAFRQNGLISDVIAPRVPVERQTDLYFIFDRANQMLNFNSLRAPGVGAQKVRRTVSSDSYNCTSHALQAPLPDESRVNAEQAGLGNIMSTQGRAGFLQSKILLDKEYRLCSQMTTALITNNDTLSGTDQWSHASSSPATYVEKAKKVIRRAGVSANLMVIGEAVYQAARNNTTILNQFRYTQRGAIGLADLAAFFDIPRVELASAVKVTADAAVTASTVWDPEDVLICYVDASPSQEDISFMRTFVWRQAPGTIGGYGVVTGRDPDPTAKSDTVGVDFYYDQKITAVETGYLLKNAVA
jgi:hypothetical protein